MIHQDLLQTIRQEKGRDGFVYPYYGKYSIAELAPTLLRLFGAPSQRPGLPARLAKLPALARPKKLFVLIDGFGFNHFLKYQERFSFLHKLAVQGEVFPLTSVFPSTTAAALTAIHTGLTPQEHGIPEWNVYFEEVDSIIQTLPFKTWSMPEYDSVLKLGAKPEMLYEGPSLYSQLQEHDVPSYVFTYYQYTESVYSRAAQRGATLVPFTSGPDLAEKISQKMAAESGPAYYFVYWGSVDSLAHEFGPDSPEHVSAIEAFCVFMEETLLKKLPPALAQETVLLAAADHGHVNIKREDIINLNKYPELEESFQTSPQGKRILPTGSPHDVFLFIQPEKRTQVMAFLQKELAGKATILTSEEALHQGLFGVGKPSPKFLRRIGTILILPHPGYHIWYEFLETGPFSMLGIHGGLSEEEMVVPFIVAELGGLL